MAAALQVWEERDREFVAAGDLTMDDDCLILLIDADTKVRAKTICRTRCQQHCLGQPLAISAQHS